MSLHFQPSSVQRNWSCGKKEYSIFHLPSLKGCGFQDVDNLPYSVKILLESAIRHFDNYAIVAKDIQNLAQWNPRDAGREQVAFKPGRVILQDFTGVPCLVDLAAMRSVLKRMGKDYKMINPQIPCDLVIDHSVQVDYFGQDEALSKNVKKEFERNRERYRFLKWGQKAFKNFRVVPPATGIVHQVNLEYFSKGILRQQDRGREVVFPDSLVGTDSHTTMINGLGIVGWGVGGIEAEAVMLGEPVTMLLPEVVGFRMRNSLKEGVTATDLVLTVTQMLRRAGVVGKFVEFFGDGIRHLTLPDRTTISNMAPEYGATVGLFPVDQETLRYYAMTGRTDEEVALIEGYYREQGLYYSGHWDVEYSEIIELDLSQVETSLAGPKRPQDRIGLGRMKSEFKKSLTDPVEKRGYGLAKHELDKTVPVQGRGNIHLSHGQVVIAAITSCTNTSNPSVLIGAGLLAKKAGERGLKTRPYVKTSLAPGSRVVTEYLNKSGLTQYLDALGFHTVGYGCTTCIGNSGPLPEEIAGAIQEGNMIVASVLSGNRNFEGRINPFTKANYLASPPLVVAFALAGRVNIDMNHEALAKDRNGQDVFLRDIWPTRREISQIIEKIISPDMFLSQYKDAFKGDEEWRSIQIEDSGIFPWAEKSTYIQEPPFFVKIEGMERKIKPITGARVLLKVGDSITTDHISPAGAIAAESPAGRYLISKGVAPKDFNSYGSRRGNDRVMARGTFANIRLRNLLVPQSEGSWTVVFPEKKETDIYTAARIYREKRTPLVVLAGKEYGTGSSRDWAAKGTAMLGIQVVLAESFERIHRSNLVGMGVLPLQFCEGENADTLNLKGNEVFDFFNLSDAVEPGSQILVRTKDDTGREKSFQGVVRLDTPVEIDYYRNGGILHTVLLKLAGLL